MKPANPVPGDCGYYLHAHQLILCHPITNEVSCYEIFHYDYDAISISIRLLYLNL